MKSKRRNGVSTTIGHNSEGAQDLDIMSDGRSVKRTRKVSYKMQRPNMSHYVA